MSRDQGPTQKPNSEDDLLTSLDLAESVLVWMILGFFAVILAFLVHQIASIAINF